jgi:hypothetical protein
VKSNFFSFKSAALAMVILDLISRIS